MEKRKKIINKTWNDVIRRMTKQELQLIVYEPDDYSTELITIAKEVLKEKYDFTEEELLSIHEPDRFINGDAGARNLLIEVLKNMGCEVSFENDDEEDDGVCDISFSYMTKLFYAYAYNESAFVTIDYYCNSCKIEDEEEVTRQKEAMNVVNEKKRVNIYYQKDEESGRLYVNCSASFLLIPLVPQLEHYLQSQLKFILNAVKYYNNVLEDLKTKKNRYEDRVGNHELRMKKVQRWKEIDAIGKVEHTVVNEITGSRDLFLDTLTKMGCPYQVDEEDNSICFEYYGCTFYAEADNEQPYVNIYYYSWGEMDLEDVEDIGETAAIRKAINEANWRNRVITVFTIDKEEKTMYVHGREEFLFIPEIPDLVNYLKTELSRFFRTEYSVRTELF